MNEQLQIFLVKCLTIGYIVMLSTGFLFIMAFMWIFLTNRAIDPVLELSYLTIPQSTFNALVLQTINDGLPFLLVFNIITSIAILFSKPDALIGCDLTGLRHTKHLKEKKEHG